LLFRKAHSYQIQNHQPWPRRQYQLHRLQAQLRIPAPQPLHLRLLLLPRTVAVSLHLLPSQLLPSDRKPQAQEAQP
jgi:hypothetical protein